jgi:DNA polymerase III delta subunit
VSIWGDNDLSATGQQAAYTLARRMHQRGIDFSVHIPPDQGTDWADGLENTSTPEGFGLRKAAD